MPPEAAVAEPTTEAPMTPLGEVYKQALAKAEGAGPDAPTEPTAPANAAPEPEPEPVAPEKPASALEAALSEPAPKPEGEKDPLSELPETLPNENRKDHWAKARAAIKNLSEARKQDVAKINELTEKLGTAKDSPELRAELEKYKAQVAKMTDDITAINVELLPEFQEKYVTGEKKLIAKATDAMKAYGGDVEALSEALALPEGRRRNAAIREAMGEDFDELGRTKINTLIAQIDTLRDEAAEERANSQQSFQRRMEQKREQEAQQAQEIEARKQLTFATVTKRLTTEVPTARLVDPAIDGAEEWNAGITEDAKAAERLFGPEAAPEDTVRTAILGTRYPRLEKMYLDLRTEYAAAKRQLAEYDGAQPDVKGGKPTPKTGKEADLEKTPGQIFRERMAALSGGDD